MMTSHVKVGHLLGQRQHRQATSGGHTLPVSGVLLIEEVAETSSVSPKIAYLLPLNVPADLIGQARAWLANDSAVKELSGGRVADELIPVGQELGRQLSRQPIADTVQGMR